MDKITDYQLYKEDVQSLVTQKCDWNKLKNKTILITGATGLIGTLLVDMFIFLNFKYSLNLNLILISRHKHKTKYNFIKYLEHDISKSITLYKKIDYVIHAASNCSPHLYSSLPVETIKGNVFGTYNLLNLVAQNEPCRFLFLSSSEIYGNDIVKLENGFSENNLGYLDCNNSRSCYNESKRLSETLCAAYNSEKKIDYVIARLCRSYGPTLKNDDTKALSQFLHNAINGEDIVLKSKGDQYYSYIYSADAASAIIFLLLNGISGEAYNIADEKSNITLKELANIIADISNTKVIFELPDEKERKGYSKAQRAILNPKKIQELGWKCNFNIQSGIERTIKYMQQNINNI